MSPRPDVSEERKVQILDAAKDVFVRLGLHKARVDDIAEEAGLSKGAVYLYFKSKDDIVLAILDRLFEREFLGLHDLIASEGPAAERLLQFNELLLLEVQEWLKLVPLAYEFLGLVFRQKIVQLGFRRYFRTYITSITQLIQQGIDSGEFIERNAKDVAIAIGAIFEGTILLWVYDPENVDVQKNIQSGMEIFLRGLIAK